ncbi:hypothetical protein [Paraburkholderia sp. DHOC27]|uniref:hypothetical protein n=1 Tax=Paraburkholderia sp. DHOC27 TaxID=2303330 RepID=UPI000E3BE665|nr:hypothetical protein [Paraburkholderia sp. DHOC27]RFU47364.1 hypothetical protein D0B32_14695 [Paraburkholderia sp. DHOC27]
MTAKTITSRLPNPDILSDPDWTLWNEFIESQGIPTCSEEVVRRYQNIEQDSWRYLEARVLNHFLNLRHFGRDSYYAELAEDYFDLEEEEYPVDASVAGLEAVFAFKACRFTSDSVVFKGVSSEPFYKIHAFEDVQPGQMLQFHGFVSTSVCRDKALDFVHKTGSLLVIRGLDLVDCVVLENLTVQTTANAHVPEHEVLLWRSVMMEVLQVVPATGHSPREVHLKAV